MPKHIVFIEGSTSGAGDSTHTYAKQRGYYVTLICKDANDYSRTIHKNSDRMVECDTNDIDTLLKNIIEIHFSNKIDGITTTADFYVPQAAISANILRLPSLSFEAASNARNKYFMRRNIQKIHPELNPNFCIATDLTEALNFVESSGYPIIAKPQNDNDSINVRKIDNDSELEEYIVNAQGWALNSSKQKIEKGVLLESYIEGDEYSVETMQTKDGEVTLIGVLEKVFMLGSEQGCFVEAGSLWPARRKDTSPLFNAAKKALDAVGIDIGVIHTELRINKKGEVKIIEINPRMVGDKIGSHVIPLAFGDAPSKYVVDIALGLDSNFQATQSGSAAMVGICSQEPGFFKEIENVDEIKSLEGVVDVNVIGKPGKYYGKPKSNGDILAEVIISSDSQENVVSVMDKVVAIAKIDMQPSMDPV